jgi:hypothetical protein
MKTFSHQRVETAVVDELKTICGADFVIFDDAKKLKKYSQSKSTSCAKLSWLWIRTISLTPGKIIRI